MKIVNTTIKKTKDFYVLGSIWKNIPTYVKEAYALKYNVKVVINRQDTLIVLNPLNISSESMMEMKKIARQQMKEEGISFDEMKLRLDNIKVITNN